MIFGASLGVQIKKSHIIRDQILIMIEHSQTNRLWSPLCYVCESEVVHTL